MAATWNGDDATCPTSVTLTMNQSGDFLYLLYSLQWYQSLSLNIVTKNQTVTIQPVSSHEDIFKAFLRALFNVPNAPHSDVVSVYQQFITDVTFPHQPNAAEIPVDNDLISSSKQTWNLPFIFHLTIVDLLIRIWTVCNEFSNLKFIGPLISLFQSSGWGKSRSIFGLAKTKLCDVLYICCREEETSGYPLQSRIFCKLRDKMNQAARSYNSNATLPWKHFAPALYAVASAYYEALLQGDVDELVGVLLDGSSNLADDIENRMNLLYEKYANLSYDEALAALIAIHQKFREKNIHSSFHDFLQNQLQNCPRDSFDARLINHWFKVFKADSQFRPIVFVFDEARTLSKTSPLPGYSMYRIIRQILRNTPRQVQGLNFVAILMDTSSSITDLAPAEKMDPSFRMERQSNLEHFRPVYDIYTLDLHGNDGVGMERLNIPHLFSLGRPLWGAFMRGVAENVDVSNSVVMLAERKLLCGLAQLQMNNQAMCIAMLATRMALSFTGRYELNESLVASHMAYCRYISHARDWIQILYLSEPVLAEAASRQWYVDYPNQLLAMVEHMRKAVDQKQIERGVKGEDVTKLLLLLARDKLTTLRNSTPSAANPHGFYYSMPISVREFLISLAGDRIENLDQIPYSLLNGMISFTHFVQLNSKIDKNVIKRLWRRCAAAQAPEGTPGFDFLVPVVIVVNSKESITYILVQVKNYSATTSENNLDDAMNFKMSRAYLYPEPRRDPADARTPYLCIYIQLGPHRATNPSIVVVRSRSTRNSSSRPTGQYCLYLSGLSSNVYPCFLQNIDLTSPQAVQKVAAVNQIVSELRVLLFSTREPLYSEKNELDGKMVVSRAQKAYPIIYDTADGTRLSRQSKNPVRVIREPEMKNL